MAGERGLYRDGGGFRVADLAHHDGVGVVAEDGAQSAGESEPLGFVDRYLQHPFQLIFRRVLDGDYLLVTGSDFAEQRVQRGRLAGAGGAGDQQHAVGPPCQRAQGVA
ncbi:hypothetical protein FQZ97_571150 [compost metagenome]